MELRGYVQTYETGQLGKNSIVASLHWSPKNKLKKIDETAEKNYAELWIGTNPNGESILRKTGEKLSKLITKHPHLLGISSYLFKDKFPFLLKVLSVATPTSLKIHPNERLAAIFHKRDPCAHPDSMHRPVLMVALSDFEIMAGFRPKHEIIFYLKEVPELNEMIEPKLLEDFIRTEKPYYLKKIFECYLTTERDKYEITLDKYFMRMEKEDYQIMTDHLFPLIHRMQELFPYHYGVFMIFFLNHFTLKKDEAIYIRPLVPYSYLQGEAVECSTNSNNEIPITFTSDIKETFIEIFIEHADYTCFEIEQLKIKPTFEPYLTKYDCDEDEFVLSKVTISKGEYYTIQGKRSLCVFIIIKGKAVTLEQNKVKDGTIMLIPPCHTYHIKVIEDMTLFMAEPNLVI